ncbi:MAG: alpha-hydroxy acid oxidase, partial [Gammaproteobacteria bacterium]|nr:alpha-hydroxy acid oxidase [Gammaproteobacteria bacterium]
MNYDTRFPSVADLKARAKKRMPGFAFEYVDGGIDQEHGKRRNREAWHDMVLTPRYLRDVSRADLSAPVFGHAYSLPLGVPPVGLGNMMWPGAEAALARAAQRANIPYILSTFSTTDLDEIAALAPDVCWFQLYVPKSAEVMKHLLKRVARANYRVLVVTLDIPVGAKRNRELRCGLKLPFSWTPGIVWQCATHPNWSLRTLRHGRPDFVNIAAYREDPNRGLSQFITHFNMHGVTRERLSLIRDLWDGPLVLKGVQYEQDMRDAADLGVDGLQPRRPPTGCGAGRGPHPARRARRSAPAHDDYGGQRHSHRPGCGAGRGAGRAHGLFRALVLLGHGRDGPGRR